MEGDIETGLLVKETHVQKKEDPRWCACVLPEWCGCAIAWWNVVFILGLIVCVVIGICKLQNVF